MKCSGTDARISRMSFDLMVFEPDAAPKDHDAFMKWYFKLTKWTDGP